MINFSSDKIAHNFCDYAIHAKLTDIILWVDHLMGEVVITSARRHRKIHKKDSGIHLTNPLRAVDVRYYIYNDPQHLVDLLNNNFIYNERSDKKVAIFHDSGMGKHIHLQCHDMTLKVGG
jgi:hypothetical protein